MSDFDLHSFWIDQAEAHIATAQATFDALESAFGQWVDVCEDSIRRGGKILTCGNGGSAADAQHIAAELSVKLHADRAPIPALCLSLDPSAMTACANDYGFDQIFSRQINALGREGDVLIGISTSGNSANVLQAFKQAKMQGLVTIGLTGEKGGSDQSPLQDLCDIILAIPESYTGRIQEMHITLGHMFCAALEKRLSLT